MSLTIIVKMLTGLVMSGKRYNSEQESSDYLDRI